MSQRLIFRVEHQERAHGPFYLGSHDRYSFNCPEHDRELDAEERPSLRPTDVDTSGCINTHSAVADRVGTNDLLYGFTSIPQLLRYFPFAQERHHPSYHVAVYRVPADAIIEDEWQCAFPRAEAQRTTHAIRFEQLDAKMEQFDGR